MKNKKILAAIAVCAAVFAPEIASAAAATAPKLTTGAAVTDPLVDMFTSLSYYTQTSVGKIITLLIIVAGLAAGIMRQSLWSFVIGVGGGLGLYNAPTIVGTLFPAMLF